MRDPKALITTTQLAAILEQPDVRVYDCTTHLEPPAPGSDDPYTVVSGRRTFEEAHVPGADFLDLQDEFSDTTTRLRFMMPPVAQLEAAFGRHGLGSGTRVVLYSIGSAMWATRFWWMLKSLGFDGAAVLDGGLDAWKGEARPVERRAARGSALDRARLAFPGVEPAVQHGGAIEAERPQHPPEARRPHRRADAV